jgi:hypothetical protein
MYFKISLQSYLLRELLTIKCSTFENILTAFIFYPKTCLAVSKEYHQIHVTPNISAEFMTQFCPKPELLP